MTESNERETRDKNEKIKRLQEDCESLRNERESRASQQRAEASQKERAEIDSLRQRAERDRGKISALEKDCEAL